MFVCVFVFCLCLCLSHDSEINIVVCEKYASLNDRLSCHGAHGKKKKALESPLVGYLVSKNGFVLLFGDAICHGVEYL